MKTTAKSTIILRSFPVQLWREIKAAAALQGETLAVWLARAARAQIKKEGKCKI